MLKIVQWCQLCAFLLQLDNRRCCSLIRIQWATVRSFLNSLEADNSDLCYCQFQSRNNRFTFKIFLNFIHNCIFIKRNQMRPLLFEKWEVTRNIRSLLQNDSAWQVCLLQRGTWPIGRFHRPGHLFQLVPRRSSSVGRFDRGLDGDSFLRQCHHFPPQVESSMIVRLFWKSFMQSHRSKVQQEGYGLCL